MAVPLFMEDSGLVSKWEKGHSSTLEEALSDSTCAYGSMSVNKLYDVMDAPFDFVKCSQRVLQLRVERAFKRTPSVGIYTTKSTDWTNFSY